MDSVDYKYANMLSVRLKYFKVKNNQPFKANFRCYICGDSQKSKTKCRGWLLDLDGKCFYKCFNCGYSKPLWFFLKHNFPPMYDDYVVDKKLEEKIYEKPKQVKPLDKLQSAKPAFTYSKSPLKSIKKLSSLPVKHPVRTYVNKRQIPVKQHHRIWYAPKFKKWVNSLIPDKLSDAVKEEPRLIFPFLDSRGRVFGFNARAFDPKSLRYITIMLDDSKPKIFGMDQVDYSREYYIVEGPIDSLFIPNSIAMAGADSNQKGIYNPDKAVYIFDNEPRNKEICKRMERLISQGYKVVIWPDHIHEKDINDMVLAGYDPMMYIRQNIYMGLQGELRMKEWRKIHND